MKNKKIDRFLRNHYLAEAKKVKTPEMPEKLRQLRRPLIKRTALRTVFVNAAFAILITFFLAVLYLHIDKPSRLAEHIRPAIERAELATRIPAGFVSIQKYLKNNL